MTSDHLTPDLESERRKYPRLEVALPTVAVTPDGKAVSVWMRNVSRAGIQLRLDRIRAGQLFPDGQIAPGASLVLRLRLPAVEEPWSEIEVRTGVIYAQRIAHDAFLIGVEYIELGAEDYQKLVSFIEASLDPAW